MPKPGAARIAAAMAAAMALGAGHARAQQAAGTAPQLQQAPIGDCESTAEQAAAAEKIPGDSSRICGSSGPGFRSTAEANAFGALQALSRDPQASAEAVNAGVAGFLAAYPQSDFRSEAAGLAVRYYVAHNNQAEILAYGKLALAADPDNLYALSVMAVSISSHVQDSDIDREARLGEAEADANHLLAVLKDFQWDPANGVNYKGHHYTPAEAASTSALYTAAAHAALGRVALVRKIYPVAVTQYQQAIDAAPAAQAAVYHYFRAKAEAALGLNDGARADYTAAIANAGSNVSVQAAAKAEMAALPGGH